MDWLKRGRHNRTSPLNLDLPQYYNEILSNLEDVRPHLRSSRKFLESSNCIATSVSRSVDLTNVPQNCSLFPLLKIHVELAKSQQDFFTEVTKELLTTFKTWEDQCDQIIKLKGDLQKTQMDVNKAKEKLRQSRDLEASKLMLGNMESNFNNEKENLCLQLYHYDNSQRGYQEKIKEYLISQTHFLQRCKERSEASYAPINSILDAPIRSFFGTSLQDHVDKDGYSVVLKLCLDYLMKNQGYSHEGIFRIAGQLTRINALRNALDKDLVDGSLLDLCGVYVVADLLKQYLRELREPLIAVQFVDNWPGGDNGQGDLPPPKKVLSLIDVYISEPNRKNLMLLLQFLSMVYKHEAASKMSPENLAVTLWMNLCPPRSFESVAKIVQYLVKYADKFLEGEKDINDILGLAGNAASMGQYSTNLTTSQKTDSTPQIPGRTYQHTGRSSGGDGGPIKAKAPGPPGRPPNYSPQVSAADGRIAPPSSRGHPTAKLSASVPDGLPHNLQQQVNSSTPVTTFDRPNHMRTTVPEVDPKASKTPPPVTETSNTQENSAKGDVSTELIPEKAPSERGKETEKKETNDKQSTSGSTSSEESVGMETTTAVSAKDGTGKQRREDCTEESRKGEEIVEKEGGSMKPISFSHSSLSKSPNDEERRRSADSHQDTKKHPTKHSGDDPERKPSINSDALKDLPERRYSSSSSLFKPENITIGWDAGLESPRERLTPNPTNAPPPPRPPNGPKK